MDVVPKRYDVIKRSLAVSIDGNWSKPFWESCPFLSLDHFMGSYPRHFPEVSCKICWDERALYLIFRVKDRYVRAVAQNYQDPVCRDSCVEFFFTPGLHLGSAYFNLEINCGGTMLFRYHPDTKTEVFIETEDAATILKAHSLPIIVDPEIEKTTLWRVEYRLPFDIIKKYAPHALPPSKGVQWRANLYKCADQSSHPHWLTWSKVDHPTPKFHLPEYFGTLHFC